MLKTGVHFSSKDGGAHESSHETKNTLTIFKKSDTINENNSPCYSDTNSSSAIGPAFHIEYGKFEVSDPASYIELHLEQEDSEIDSHSMQVEEENEIGNNQGLDWLKSNANTSDVDMLEMSNKDCTLMPTMGLDSHSLIGGSDADLSSENLDYVFSKQHNYFEVLDGGEYVTSLSNFAGQATINWGSQHTQQLVANADSCHQLSLSTDTNNCSANDPVGSFVSFPDTGDILEEPLNNTCNVSSNEIDLNSMLFENINKSESSAVKVVQFSPNATSFITGNLNSESHTDNALSGSILKAVPLSIAGSMPIPENISITNLHDVNTDLNLNSLPNFLGLENSQCHTHSFTTPSISSDYIDSQTVVNILQGLTPAISQPENGIKFENSTSRLIQDHHLAHQSLSVTTISISNDDENATKILVDSHQGQQQMYVIKTADLNQTSSTKLNINQGQQMFVINASDLKQEQTASFSVETVDPTRAQTDTVVRNSQSINIPASGIPGIVFMPVTVVDSAKNVIQTVPLQIVENEDTKRSKKLLMCSEPGCRKTFKKASKLKVHQMLHTGERPFKCNWLGCEWAFTTSNKLKRHLESHEGRKDYVCDKPGCGHRFTTIYNLNTHRKLHERPCTELCPKNGCHESFPTKKQLDIHLRNVHAFEDRTFKCPEPDCEKVFFSSGCMGSHMRIHQQNLEDLRCKYPECGKEFTKTCRLKQHEKLHTGEKPFACDFPGCNWAFATVSKLKRHQTKHTGVRKWACPMCRKQFHRSEHLRGHLITHSGDRPFVCPVEGCGNTFTAKSSLYVHLKKHDESGKTIVYHCPMEKCERHYANKASLRQHILVKHCNVPQNESTSSTHGASNWLSLLGPGDPNNEINFSQESYTEALTQAALTPSHDSMLATDFLTGGMADQSLLNSSSESMPDPSCNNLISHLMVSTSDSLTSPSLTVSASEIQLPQPQLQLYQEDHIDQRLLEASDILQRERLSSEAVERGRKSQIMLENMHGSARTDPRSNDIISQRSLKRWQKQKIIEAAKLKTQLEAQSRPKSPVSIVVNASGDYKNPVSNNVSLSGQQRVKTELVSRPLGLNADNVASIKAEIPDMELHAEDISDMILDGSTISADSFMTDLFIRDPETGITYRQTQLLQDDPPNPDMMEDIDVAPSHSMDPSLDAHFVEDSLTFHSIE
ncbi:unnamed protein product [Lymnaea stagnalis]|uniref:C2H2-type domain-containing protein n=1 Tax=Lymnaea stagnalis TaxID=6523 RepID=A0AAV2HM35_LYMST